MNNCFYLCSSRDRVNPGKIRRIGMYGFYHPWYITSSVSWDIFKDCNSLISFSHDGEWQKWELKGVCCITKLVTLYNNLGRFLTNYLDCLIWKFLKLKCIQWKLMLWIVCVSFTASKVSKYGLEKTLYLDNFHTVIPMFLIVLFSNHFPLNLFLIAALLQKYLMLLFF